MKICVYVFMELLCKSNRLAVYDVLTWQAGSGPGGYSGPQRYCLGRPDRLPYRNGRRRVINYRLEDSRGGAASLVIVFTVGNPLLSLGSDVGGDWTSCESCKGNGLVGRSLKHHWAHGLVPISAESGTLPKPWYKRLSCKKITDLCLMMSLI